MPTLKRKPVPLVPLPEGVRDDTLPPETEVFYLQATGEIFLDFESVPALFRLVHVTHALLADPTRTAFRFTFKRSSHVKLRAKAVWTTILHSTRSDASMK